MPDIDALADTEIISALEYEADIPCEGKLAHGCTKIARWLRICKRCGADRPVCDANRQYIINGGKVFRDVWRCADCKHTVNKDQGHLWSFVPLK